MAGLAGADLDCLQSFSCLQVRTPVCSDARSASESVTCADIVSLDLCSSSLGQCK